MPSRGRDSMVRSLDRLPVRACAGIDEAGPVSLAQRKTSAPLSSVSTSTPYPHACRDAAFTGGLFQPISVPKPDFLVRPVSIIAPPAAICINAGSGYAVFRDEAKAQPLLRNVFQLRSSLVCLPRWSDANIGSQSKNKGRLIGEACSRMTTSHGNDKLFSLICTAFTQPCSTF